MLLRITTNLLLAGPTNSLQSLGQDRVAVVVGGVHPVGIHGGEVLDLELDEGRGKFGGVAELVGEGVYVGLAFAGHYRDQDRILEIITYQPQTRTFS